MTPGAGGGSAMAVVGAVEGDAQPGKLRGCQTTGVCYGPDQIRVAYGFNPLLSHGVDGSGRTIVIIDAYGSDTLAQDLSTFDTYFGIPAGMVNVIYPDGPPSPTSAANLAGWKGETTLDVEWAHTIAPGATIDLVVAKSNNDSDILSATQYVADHNLGDVLSQSYGEAEQCMDPSLLAQQHRVFDQLSRENITLFASAGDWGAAQITCDGTALFKAASTPATDPDVTAVGGTKLVAQPATADANGFVAAIGGNYLSESVWNEGTGSSTGGGVSVVFPRPDYQAPIVKDSHMREVPDIAYNAAVNGGVLGVYTCEAGDPNCGPLVGQFFFRFGGTSAGSPQWAGLIALTDQLANGRVGAINKALYRIGKSSVAPVFFHDVTTGDNSVPASSIPGTPITGVSAGPGWDAATGWGSPIAYALAPALAASGFDVERR
jgi:subtilase family serine protease